MPTIKLPTAVGIVPFQYTISTPTNSNADQIDPTLPTIVFLHGDFFPSETMHPQFGDPEIRAFNLVATDFRGWSSIVGPTYDQHEAADDVYQLILALKLPPVFMCAISQGTIAAFQLAVSHPECVRGVFLASHLCSAELPEVLEGRIEIYDLWMEGVVQNDMDYVHDSLIGSHQLAYNNNYTNLTSALLKVAIGRSSFRQGIETHSAADKHLLVDFFARRRSYSPAQLATFARSAIPVCVVAGDEDAAYPISYTEDFVHQLTAAGVQAEQHIVARAPHILSISHFPEFNRLLRQFVLANLNGQPVPPTPDASTIESPFLDTLVKAGLIPGEEYEPVDGLNST